MRYCSVWCPNGICIGMLLPTLNQVCSMVVCGYSVLDAHHCGREWAEVKPHPAATAGRILRWYCTHPSTAHPQPFTLAHAHTQTAHNYTLRTLTRSLASTFPCCCALWEASGGPKPHPKPGPPPPLSISGALNGVQTASRNSVPLVSAFS